MKDSYLLIAGLIVAFCAGASGSVLFLRWRKSRSVPKYATNGYGPWSIGVYEGDTPFEISEAPGIANPVLSARDVKDMDVRFVADPFMTCVNGRFHVFFEALKKDSNRGVIAFAESDDAKNWTYKGVAIEEKFHLSYPYIFADNGDYYMIPESGEDLTVRLYKATHFPDKWEHVANLLSGYRYLDASVFRHQDTWWMFVATEASNVLNLYFSDDLARGWQPHPMNPVVKRNGHIARPGGRVIVYNDKLYRFAQDDDPGYGIQVFALEITELSKTSYREKITSERPVVKMTGRGWNAGGMHTVDVQKVGNRWMALVDGADRPVR